MDRAPLIVCSVCLVNESAAREKLAGGIVDHIYLAGVETWLQRVERQVELKGSGLAIASVEFGELDLRAFEDFGLSTQERNVGEQGHAVFVWRGCAACAVTARTRS